MNRGVHHWQHKSYFQNCAKGIFNEFANIRKTKLNPPPTAGLPRKKFSRRKHFLCTNLSRVQLISKIISGMNENKFTHAREIARNF